MKSKKRPLVFFAKDLYRTAHSINPFMTLDCGTNTINIKCGSQNEGWKLYESLVGFFYPKTKFQNEVRSRKRASK